MRDSNPRMHGPEPCALPLGQSPITVIYYTLSGVRIVNIKRNSTHLWRARNYILESIAFRSRFPCVLPQAILTPNAWTRTMCLGTFRAPTFLTTSLAYNQKRFLAKCHRHFSHLANPQCLILYLSIL